MLEALFGCGPVGGVEGEHRQQPVGERLRHLRVPLVLLREHVVEAPRLQFCDVAEFTFN